MNLSNSCREGTAKFADMENTSMTLGRHQRKKSSTSTLNKKKSVWDPSVSSYLLIVVLSNKKLAVRHRVELKEFEIQAQVIAPIVPGWIQTNVNFFAVLYSSRDSTVSRYLPHGPHYGRHSKSRLDGGKLDKF